MNMPSPDKTMLSVRIPRLLYHKVKKLADARHGTVSEFVLVALTKATVKVELTPDDFKMIERETAKAQLRGR